jgi:hypothetical protein
MPKSRKWQFKTRLRAHAFGWRGTNLAISRLKEAVSEIKAAAISDPIAASDGVVSLMERIRPARLTATSRGSHSPRICISARFDWLPAATPLIELSDVHPAAVEERKRHMLEQINRDLDALMAALQLVLTAGGSH